MFAQALPGHCGLAPAQLIAPYDGYIGTRFHKFRLFGAETANANFCQGNAHIDDAPFDGGVGELRAFVLVAQISMRVDMYNSEVGEKFARGGDGRRGKRMLATKYERKLTALQYFARGCAGGLKGGGVIHAPVIEGRARIYACFNGTPVQFFIVEFHLAGCIEYRLRPAFGAFHIAHTIFQRSRNDGDASSGRITKGRIRRAELGHRRCRHAGKMLLLFSAPPVWPGALPSLLRSAPGRAFRDAASGCRVLQSATRYRWTGISPWRRRWRPPD